MATRRHPDDCSRPLRRGSANVLLPRLRLLSLRLPLVRTAESKTSRARCRLRSIRGSLRVPNRRIHLVLLRRSATLLQRSAKADGARRRAQRSTRRWRITAMVGEQAARAVYSTRDS